MLFKDKIIYIMMTTDINFKKFVINNDFLNNFSNLQEEIKKDNNNFVKKSKVNILEDSLFWCFYKIINGEFNYILNKGFKEQINTKINFVEELRKKKTELKQNKIKLSNIESEIVNNKDISLEILHALCILYNKNIIYCKNYIFFNMIQNDDDDIYLISNKDNGFQLKENIGIEKLNYFKNNFYEIQNINKPIKAINNYSKEELIIFAKKLSLEFNNKINKQDLYQKIKIESMKFK